MPNLLDCVADEILRERVKIIETGQGTFLHPPTPLEIFVEKLAREWKIPLPVLKHRNRLDLALPVHLTLDSFGGDRYHDGILFDHRKPGLIHLGEIKVPTLFLYLAQQYRIGDEDAPVIDYVQYPSRAFQQKVYEAIHRQDTLGDRLLLELWNMPYFSIRPRVVDESRAGDAVVQTKTFGNGQVHKWFMNYLRRNPRLRSSGEASQEEINNHLEDLYADSRPNAEFVSLQSRGERLDIKVVPQVGVWVNVFPRDANKRINGLLYDMFASGRIKSNPAEQRKFVISGDYFGLGNGLPSGEGMMNVFEFAHRYLPNPNAHPNA